MARMKRLVLVCLILAPLASRAGALEDLATQSLVEPMPFSFMDVGVDERDFALEWETPPPAGLQHRWVEGSFSRVRTDGLMVLRALAEFRYASSEGAKAEILRNDEVEFLGRRSQLSSDGKHAGLLSMPLIDHPKLRGRLMVKGQDYFFRIRLRPRAETAKISRIFIDTSCFSFMPEVELKNVQADTQWVSVGCALIRAEGVASPKSYLKVSILRSGATSGEGLELFDISQGSAPIERKSPDGDLHAKFRVPAATPLGSLGMGLGPYVYEHGTVGNLSQTIAPAFSLYASYFLNDASQLVFFNSTLVHKNGFADSGAYMRARTALFLEDRLSFHVLLGGQIMAVRSNGKINFIPNFPQGAEILFRNAFKPRMNLMAGAFIYPTIAGQSYNNIYLRWGGRQFVEINYISWMQPIDDRSVAGSKWGLSFGFPLGNFL
jgi:hypothetical protein